MVFTQLSRTTGRLALGSLLFASAAADAEVTTLPPTLVLGDRLEGTIETGAAVLSPEDVEFYQIESLQDLAAMAPNLYFTHSDSRGYGDNVTFRGQGNTVFFSPPAVGYYVDDVPSSDAYAYPSEFMGMDRVLFHRGPQGSGFGRNGAAGMIEIVTAGPSELQETTLGLEYGSYDYMGVRLGSSGPLGGDFSHTLQFYYNERDGYVKNTFLDRHTDDREAMGILANLYWNPREDMEWRLRVLVEQARDGSSRLTALPDNIFGSYTGDPYTVQSNFAGKTAMDRYQLSLHGRRDFDWGTLKSITSYQKWELDPSTVDLDLGPYDLATSRITQEQSFITQELRFESPDDAGPLAWRAGLFFSDKDTEGDAIRTFPLPFMPYTGSERTLFDIEETNVAGYGRLTYAATEQLTLHAGGRVDYYDTSMVRSSDHTLFGATGVQKFSTEDTYFSPIGGLRYAVNDQVSLYATTGLGIKPKGFSAFSASDPTGASFDEETAWANEIGIDVRSLDDDWSFAVRGFWNEIDDYQLNRSVPNQNDFIVVNADEVTSRGVEAEFRWRPIEPLEFQAAVGFQDTEFDRYSEGMTSYDGNSVPFTPDFTAAGGFRYDLPCGWFLGSTARLIGETYYDAANSSEFRQDDHVVVDAQFGYERDDLRVTLYGRNLFDEEYYNFINDQITAGSPGDPQVFGVKVDLSF